MSSANSKPTSGRRGETAFIDDGYTITGFIKSEPGLFPDVRFTYRPALIEQRAAVMASIDKAVDSAHAERKLAEHLSKHLLTWDLKGRDGGGRELSPASILRLEPRLYNRLIAIALYGSDPGDIDPNWSDAQKEEADETLAFSAIANAAAAATGQPARPIADVADEAAVKNSVAG